ncbi:NADPH:quinone reductase-like Zn-dependent oxidoreductase [Evansella vedderi]|uniref:NADPH:quinone reductase-like Zn-dependent oxidoreductase n=1 Tax=Evansella vedderi TaxID=38282 RepID=A0ABT9ZUY3_9BACI|nr:zinc-binding dehydrogenase [Evansella vedderi]MDQ0254679.1 NADPH:quinone reductase-like Zn-dependent oxidoreductase [Evansella vedderi]
MKAVVIRETGGTEKLLLEEVPIPKVGCGEVLIRLHYAAMNRRDIFVRMGLYPGVKFPSIPGADGAGEVVSVGEGVKGLGKGSNVLINPALNWGDNPRFTGKEFSILGVPTDGTHAQYVKVPAENVVKKPAFLSWEEGAALPLAGLTAYRALFTRGALREGETVVIPGIGGGVATFLLQMAVAVGAKVYVTSSDEKKIEQAVKLGAKGGVNYRTPDWGKELKEMTGGVDISIDTIGGDTFNQLIHLARPGSRIVTFGATTGPVPNLIMPIVFLKQLDILGTTMGTPEEFQGLIDFYEKHSIHPIVDTIFPLEQIQVAHHYMEQGNQFGKIVLKIPQ